MARQRVRQRPPTGHVTVSELSQLTQVPNSTLKHWIGRDLFRTVRFAGRQIAISRKAWNKFAEANGQPVVEVS